MVKLDAVRQSPASILQNLKTSRKAYDKAWASAARAPIFCKITKKTTSDGKVCLYPIYNPYRVFSPLFDFVETVCRYSQSKKFYRTARLIGSHAYMIAASGAAANASAIMEAECNILREDIESESARAPWLPQVSTGAKMVLEQWLCALAQEATKKAHAVREGCGNVKRLNRKHMQIGWDTVFENVFSNTAIMPRSTFIAPVVTKKDSKQSVKTKEPKAGGDDEDYTEEEAPVDGEAPVDNEEE